MSRSPLTLRPHDVAVALQHVITPNVTFRELAKRVELSVAEAHNSTRRLTTARLLSADGHLVNRSALLDFLVSGVPYAFPGVLGAQTRGVRTAHSGPVPDESFGSADALVWPSENGDARGTALEPLYPGAARLPASNPELYRWLTVVDALRVGRARDRTLARDFFKERLLSAGGDAA